jgi:SNF2 family DNA or RNA helicase
MLRRTKKSEIDGKPILNLPDKVMEVAHCVFSEAEDEFYQALEGKIQLQFNKYQKVSFEHSSYKEIQRLICLRLVV